MNDRRQALILHSIFQFVFKIYGQLQKKIWAEPARPGHQARWEQDQTNLVLILRVFWLYWLHLALSEAPVQQAACRLAALSAVALQNCQIVEYDKLCKIWVPPKVSMPHPKNRELFWEIFSFWDGPKNVIGYCLDYRRNAKDISNARNISNAWNLSNELSIYYLIGRSG